MNVARRFRGIAAIGLFLTIVSTATAEYSGGTGEPNDPYQIATAADLIALGETPEDYDKHFVMTADIDLDPNLPGRKAFDKAVIATDWPGFTGVFDGNGHTISKLTVRGEGHLGLFGALGSGAEVKNLGVVDVNVTSLAWGTGGVVGLNYAGSVTQCFSTGVVSGDGRDVGGLVGGNAGDVTQCYSISKVRGKGAVGGLVGSNLISFGWGTSWGAGTICNCYSAGMVDGNEYVGGLVGVNIWGGGDFPVFEGMVAACFWDTQTSRQANSAGGTGLTTSQMQDSQTYLDARWDFVGETKNGTHEIWEMPERSGYPVLAVLNGYKPPQLQGLGTSENPYLIHNALELGSMIHHSSSAHYRLASSVDLSGVHWGVAVIPRFGGTFDGNNLTVSHLTIQGNGYLGLFGQLDSSGEVKDLGVVEVNITSPDNITGESYCVGGLVGLSYGAISKGYSTGTVHGGPTGGMLGGLVGCNSSWYSKAGVVTRCYSTASIRGGTRVGGLVGCNTGAVTECHSTGPVSGTGDCVGGLAGENWNGSVIHCYSAGLVSGTFNVGGLVGSGYPEKVTACFWDTQASGQTTSDGGTGKTTPEMQVETTFAEAGWDFINETANGTEDIWWINEGKDYPHLWWEAHDRLLIIDDG